MNKLSSTWANCKSVKLPRTDTNASDLYNSEFLVKLAVTIFKLFYDMNFSKGTDIWEIIERSLSNLSRYHPYLTSYCVCFGMFWNFVWTVLLIKKTASQFPRKNSHLKENSLSSVNIDFKIKFCNFLDNFIKLDLKFRIKLC